jgi:hypothetical protein
MPQNVNIINGDLSGNLNFPVPGKKTTPDLVKYISIGWSNYGEIFIVADKRMPNTIFVIFRGPYSIRTISLFSNPTSIFPLTVCNDSKGVPDKFLYGIFKASSEMIHTIVETIRYLATDFLGATTPNSVKIFTTGHSLGAAMCTDFAYLWMGIKKTSPYNSAPYNVLADNIVCVSLGSPRCMGDNVAKKFCNFALQQKILYLRITTRGDPIVNLPYGTGFVHPCSDKNVNRNQVWEDCNSTLNLLPTPNVNYSANLDCLNRETRVYVRNPFSHTIYLDIMYTKAVDIIKLLKGIKISEANPFGQEVARGPNNATICRLIMGQSGDYKAIFFDVNKARENETNVDAELEKELDKVDPKTIADINAPAAASNTPADNTVNPVDNTSNPPVDNTSNPPVDNTSNPPVDNTVNNPADSTVNNPADNTVNNPVDNTVNNPVDNTVNLVDNNAADSTVNNPVDNTVNNPVDNIPVDNTGVDNTVNPVDNIPVDNTGVDNTGNNAVDNNVNNPVDNNVNNPVDNKDKQITGGGWFSWICPKRGIKTDDIDPSGDPVTNTNQSDDTTTNNETNATSDDITTTDNVTDADGSTTTGSKPSVLSRISKLMKIGGEVSEDIKMTNESFNALVQQMVPLQGNLCPLKGKIVNPFDNQVMPNLGCPGIKFGGSKLSSRKITRKFKPARKFKITRKFGNNSKFRSTRKLRSSNKNRKKHKIRKTHRK